MLGDSDKPLVLYGEGGCGKTSLLAKSAGLTSSTWLIGKKPISIIRFLGTTPDSSALTPTLISICQQVSAAYTSFRFKRWNVFVVVLRSRTIMDCRLKRSRTIWCRSQPTLNICWPWLAPNSPFCYFWIVSINWQVYRATNCRGCLRGYHQTVR